MSANDRVPPGYARYDQAKFWQIHDEYFQTRGIEAWSEGDIPLLATNNYPVAMQYAALFLASVEAREAAGQIAPDAPVTLLEVGGGAGRFAANFLRALEVAFDERGRRLAARLRYLLSDYAERTLREAIATPRLRRAVEAGRVIPARFDCRRPRELDALDGGPLELALDGAIFNYVGCVLPTRHLQKHDGQWFELYAHTGPEVAHRLNVDCGWKPVRLEELFAGDELHAALLERRFADLPDATFAYPQALIDCLMGLRERLRPGALVTLQDFGPTEVEELAGLTFRPPRVYGRTLNHGVTFPIFDELAAATRSGIMRTRSPLDSIQHLALAFARPIDEAEERAFSAEFVDENGSEDLLDFLAAARRMSEGGEGRRAMRFFARAIEIDPYDPELFRRLARVCRAEGFNQLADEYARRAAALDET